MSGRWPFSSGVDNSDWNMLAVTVYEDDKPVDWRLCLVAKSDYKVIDTWYAMGMVGTGSKDIEVKEVFVPERRALALARCRGGLEHPGAKLNKGDLFRVPIVASAGHPLSATALGAAEGAYEHVVDSFKTRMGTYTGAKVADFQAVQIRVARARALIDGARYLMRESALVFRTRKNWKPKRSCACVRRTPSPSINAMKRLKRCGPATARTPSIPATRCSASSATCRR